MNAHLYAYDDTGAAIDTPLTITRSQQMRESIPSLYRTCPNPPSPPREHFRWADGWVRIVEGNAEELAQWVRERR